MQIKMSGKQTGERPKVWPLISVVWPSFSIRGGKSFAIAEILSDLPIDETFLIPSPPAQM